MGTVSSTRVANSLVSALAGGRYAEAPLRVFTIRTDRSVTLTGHRAAF